MTHIPGKELRLKHICQNRTSAIEQFDGGAKAKKHLTLGNDGGGTVIIH
jgi:hypothetical protein